MYLYMYVHVMQYNVTHQGQCVQLWSGTVDSQKLKDEVEFWSQARKHVTCGNKHYWHTYW